LLRVRLFSFGRSTFFRNEIHDTFEDFLRAFKADFVSVRVPKPNLNHATVGLFHTGDGRAWRFDGEVKQALVGIARIRHGCSQRRRWENRCRGDNERLVTFALSDVDRTLELQGESRRRCLWMERPSMGAEEIDAVRLELANEPIYSVRYFARKIFGHGRNLAGVIGQIEYNFCTGQMGKG
jgi:hypothetical protein